MDEMNVKAVETTENKESRPKIIAVDFDGCLVQSSRRGFGKGAGILQRAGYPSGRGQ